MVQKTTDTQLFPDRDKNDDLLSQLYSATGGLFFSIVSIGILSKEGKYYFSSISTAFFSCSMMSMCWGQTDSHWPHSMQALALPPREVAQP